MDPLRRATGLSLRAMRPCEPEKATPMETDAQPPKRNVLNSWRRILLRANVLKEAAALQATFIELSALVSRRTLPPRMPRPVRMDEQVGIQLLTREEVIIRDRLSDSQTNKTLREPEECQHLSGFFDRGSGGKRTSGQQSGTYWFTCRDCTARWPREHWERSL